MPQDPSTEMPLSPTACSFLESMSALINKTFHFLNPVEESDTNWHMARSILRKELAFTDELDPTLFTDLPTDTPEVEGDLKKAC